MYTNSTIVTGQYDKPTRRLLIAIERGRGLLLQRYVRLLVSEVRGKGQL